MGISFSENNIMTSGGKRTAGTSGERTGEFLKRSRADYAGRRSGNGSGRVLRNRRGSRRNRNGRPNRSRRQRGKGFRSNQMPGMPRTLTLNGGDQLIKKIFHLRAGGCQN